MISFSDFSSLFELSAAISFGLLSFSLISGKGLHVVMNTWEESYLKNLLNKLKGDIGKLKGMLANNPANETHVKSLRKKVKKQSKIEVIEKYIRENSEHITMTHGFAPSCFFVGMYCMMILAAIGFAGLCKGFDFSGVSVASSICTLVFLLIMYVNDWYSIERRKTFVFHKLVFPYLLVTIMAMTLSVLLSYKLKCIKVFVTLLLLPLFLFHPLTLYFLRFRIILKKIYCSRSAGGSNPQMDRIRIP